MKKRTKIVGLAFALALFLILLEVRDRVSGRAADLGVPLPPPSGASTPGPPSSYVGFLYGRITTTDDGPGGASTYEGRLRWGGDEEAFWGDFFNGLKVDNPWLGQVPPERLVESRPIELFGLEVARREAEVDLSRPFMARFGDIARIEADSRDLRVTLKSGTVHKLDRASADDLADGLRVWDSNRGIVDFHELRIRSVELMPAVALAGTPARLHGQVRTRQGTFTGFVSWNRDKCVGTDELTGRGSDGELSLRFDTIRSIAAESPDSASVTLHDGREFLLTSGRDVGEGNRGIYVDDRRYGRIRVSWGAFERVDFDAADSGPGYSDFLPGRALAGTVTTTDGRSLAGRLVYDLDETETTETLDAPFEGLDYTIPFELIASIVRAGGEAGGIPRSTVTLWSGAELELERRGDLGEGNAGMLVFADRRESAEYVAWSEVDRIELDRPAEALKRIAESGGPR